MRHRHGLASRLLALLLLAGAAGPIFTAEKPYKCPLDTQSCLNQMVARLKKSGWLGIEYDERQSAGGLKVTRVVPGSPAEGAGLRKGDLLVALEGVRFADNTPDRCLTCEKTKDRWIPGETLDYLISREGKEFHVKVTLAALPSDVMAQMIGMHMLEHAQPVAPKQ